MQASAQESHAAPVLPYRDGHRFYLEAGWPSVLPVNGKGQTPAGYTGYKGTTRPTDDAVADWVRYRGEQNLTLRLPRNAVGIDVDAYKDMSAAESSLSRWQLPPTVRSSARLLDGDYDGVSGIRVYRVSDAAAAVADQAVWRSNDAGAVDLVRFGHRQVVCWPSVHPKRGSRYRWLDERTGEVLPEGVVPRFDDLPLLPDAVVEEFLKPAVPDGAGKASGTFGTASGGSQSTKRGAGKASGTFGTASGGSQSTKYATAGAPCPAVASVLGRAAVAVKTGSHRHDDATKCTLALVRLGEQGHRGVAKALDTLCGLFVAELDAERGGDAGGEFWRMLSNVDAVIEGEGLTPDDRRGCCGDGEAWGDPEPLERALVPVATAALPAEMRSVVEDVAAWTDTAADLGVLAALAAVSAATFGAVGVETWFGDVEPVSVYCLGAAPSGDRKSQVLKSIAVNPVRRALFDAAEACAVDRQDSDIRLKHAEREAKRLDRTTKAVDYADYERAQRELAEAAKAYRAVPNTIVNDATTEALIMRAHDQRGPFFVVSDEAQALANIAGHYSDGRANVGFLNSAYDGADYSYDRVGNGTRFIPQATAVVCVFAQPDVLAGYAKAATDASGFLPRYLLAVPASRVGRRSGDVVAKPDLETWSDVVRAIGGWAFGVHWKRTADVDRYADRHVMRCTAEVHARAVGYFREIEARMDSGGALEDYREWGSRHTARLLRVAALLSLVRNHGDPGAAVVELCDWDAAYSLAAWMESHAAELLRTMRGGRTGDGRLRQVAAWVGKQGGGAVFTSRDAWRALHGRAWVSSSSDVEDVLCELERRGWLRARPEETGGRPTVRWTVNPYLSVPGHGAKSAESPAAPVNLYSSVPGHGAKSAESPGANAALVEAAIAESRRDTEAMRAAAAGAVA